MNAIYTSYRYIADHTTANVQWAAQSIKDRALRPSAAIVAIGAVALPLIANPLLKWGGAISDAIASNPKLVISGIGGLIGMVAYQTKRAFNLKKSKITYFPENGRYEGGFVDGNINGLGMYWVPNGDRYIGGFKNEKMDGRGTLTKVTGDIYEGEWKNGHINGKGTWYFPNVGRYEGNWKDGKMSGQGTFYYVDGDIHQGEWNNGKIEGEATIWHSNGDIYKGGFFENRRDGIGTYYMYNRDTPIEGKWKNDVFLTDVSFMSHTTFLEALLEGYRIPEIIPLAVVADWFRSENIYPDILKSFECALDVALDPINSVGWIWDDLMENKTSLLPMNMIEHATLLEIVPNGEYFVFKMYNSGSGLSYHSKDPTSDRFQTELQIQVPKTSVDLEVIKKLAAPSELTVEAAYEFLLTLPDAIKLENPYPIYQKLQKHENCSLESVFAYLKNRLGEEEYHRMRIQFFERCIRAVEDRSTPESIRAKFLPKLEEKKKNRLIRHSKVKLGSFETI